MEAALSEVTLGGQRGSARDQNRGLVLELILEESPLSRAQILDRTGLSRSTVGRVLDELAEAGLIAERPTSDRAQSRGRPVRGIIASPQIGHVMGADIGVETTRVMWADLNGTILHRERVHTPRLPNVSDLATWFCELIRRVRPPGSGECLQSVISVPAKVIDGVSIVRPAVGLSNIAGSDFFARVAYELGGHVELRSDPDMALTGEMVDGAAKGFRDVALLVISTALAGSVAVDGVQLAERRQIVGEFGFYPYPYRDGFTLADVLSLQGIRGRADHEGVALPPTSEFLDALVNGEFQIYREDFIRGLHIAVTALALSLDPEIVVFGGRTVPLVSSILPEVADRLQQTLPQIPQLAVSRSDGYSQPRGTIEVGLSCARKRLRESTALND
ncbi:ROK family protein [Rhodococcus sp. NPDC060176]|uniref:ROK family transcriptional regulator n=1 Tax=Rhodococcus sp. NPDC060176 TaxID=3347062 RepID=UPI0036608409